MRVDRSRPKREEKRAPRPAARRAEDAPAKERSREKAPGHGPRREILAVACLAIGTVLALALLTHDAAGGANLIGPAGAWVARGLFAFLGLSAFLVPAGLLAGFVVLVRPAAPRPGAVTTAAFVAIVLCGAMLLDLVAPDARLFGARPGGWLGGQLADGMARLFGTVGAVILVAAAMAAALILAIGLPFSRIALFAGAVAKRLSLAVAAFVQKQIEQHRAEREAMRAELAAEEDGDTSEEDAIAEAAMAAAAEDTAPDEEKPRKKGRKKKDEATLEADPDGRVLPLPALEEHVPAVILPLAKREEPPPVEPPPPETDAAGSLLPPDPAWAIGEPIAPKLPSRKRKAELAEASTATDVAGFAADAPPEPPPAEAAETPDVSSLPPAAVQALQKAGKLPVPTIELPKAPPKPKKDADAAFDLIQSEEGFSLPPMSLLDGRDEAHQVTIDEGLLHSTAEKLRQKLADFGIQGHVERIRPGPVVTMYEFAPAAGVKISKIASLSDDLAMALEALRVRIVAPIPGRGVVGIEVPNKTREIVYLKEIVEQDVFRKSSSKLTMAIGKDIEGMPFAADLGKMPHLLMAGTTGSGKSVSVNSMIMSLLFKATPEEVRFIMVDPKMLELSIYEGIPHLLLPVVTDPKKAALALRWAVDEMERRYALLAESGVRDLASFNKQVAEKQAAAARGELPPAPVEPPKPSKLLIIDVEAGETEERAVERMEAAADAAAGAIPAAPVEEKPAPKKLPYVVIIIDELADLMMVASKEVETYIARIAQKARAAGIHLMVATQRPSVDVVTGIIKANFPSRISFLLRSRVDSQTILDTQGAEKLLGQGDMLILPPTSSHIQRVHGALVTEKEIKRVVDHLKAQGKPIYDESILQAPEEDVEGGGEEDELSDELYDQAIAIVSEMRTVSISMLQRKMRIGYNRSARMIERMERDGIVGPADGAKPREVLIRGLGEMSERQG